MRNIDKMYDAIKSGVSIEYAFMPKYVNATTAAKENNLAQKEELYSKKAEEITKKLKEFGIEIR